MSSISHSVEPRKTLIFSFDNGRFFESYCLKNNCKLVGLFTRSTTFETEITCDTPNGKVDYKIVFVNGKGTQVNPLTGVARDIKYDYANSYGYWIVFSTMFDKSVMEKLDWDYYSGKPDSVIHLADDSYAKISFDREHSNHEMFRFVDLSAGFKVTYHPTASENEINDYRSSAKMKWACKGVRLHTRLLYANTRLQDMPDVGVLSDDELSDLLGDVDPDTKADLLQVYHTGIDVVSDDAIRTKLKEQSRHQFRYIMHNITKDGTRRVLDELSDAWNGCIIGRMDCIQTIFDRLSRYKHDFPQQMKNALRHYKEDVLKKLAYWIIETFKDRIRFDLSYIYNRLVFMYKDTLRLNDDISNIAARAPRFSDKLTTLLDTMLHDFFDPILFVERIVSDINSQDADSFTTHEAIFQWCSSDDCGSFNPHSIFYNEEEKEYYTTPHSETIGSIHVHPGVVLDMLEAIF